MPITSPLVRSEYSGRGPSVTGLKGFEGAGKIGAVVIGVGASFRSALALAFGVVAGALSSVERLHRDAEVDNWRREGATAVCRLGSERSVDATARRDIFAGCVVGYETVHWR